jgi:hypothetical protein
MSPGGRLEACRLVELERGQLEACRLVDVA